MIVGLSENGPRGDIIETDSGPLDDTVQAPKTYLRHNRLHVRGGAQFLGNFATKISVNGADLGTEIGLEDDLGFDSDVFTGRLDFDWRIGQRHHVIGSWYAIERDSTFSIDEDIAFDDVVFQVGASMTTAMDVDIVRLGYRYDFWQDRRTEAGVSIGAHTLIADLQLTGMADVDGMGTVIDATRSANVAAPLPVLGTYLNWALANRWNLSITSEFFALEFEQFKGALFDNQLILEYEITENFGLGLGYNHFLIDVEVSENSYRGDFGYTYNGLLLFLSGWF